eukprot:scaffold24787_cov62-Isochrysis_galbana.AAC.1
MTGISRAFSEVKTASPHTHPAWPDQFLAHQISVKHPGIPLEIEDRPADTGEGDVRLKIGWTGSFFPPSTGRKADSPRRREEGIRRAFHPHHPPDRWS